MEGFQAKAVGTITDGLSELEGGHADLVLLDLMLPDGSGFELLQRMHQEYTSIPVIVLTAKNEMNDKILGFQLGADDYLTKPFETRELLERIKAVMRRMKADVPPETINIGCIEIDKRERSLKLSGQLIKTTSKEFDFMWLLCTNPKKVFTREQLLDRVWGCGIKCFSNMP